MIDPLHQFEIHRLIPLSLFGYDISFTNSSLFMVFCTLFISAFLWFSTNPNGMIPGRLQVISESLYQFAATMIRENAGAEGAKFFPFILSLFLFILMGNLVGLMPYAFTFTSHIIVTFTMALIVLTMVTIVGFMKHGLRFFTLFFPKGAPIYIAPLLIPVELMSYLSRPVSLAVRLFANMMAGHVMLKIFAAFVAILGASGYLPTTILAILPFSVGVAMMAFEILVAFLQAYVFAVLACIYLNDALHLH